MARHDWLKLCLVIGPSNCLYWSFEETVQQAVSGGVTSVQLREKSLSNHELIEIGQRLINLLPPSVPLVINDRVEVAQALGCHLHLGQDDAAFNQARKQLKPGQKIGLSVNNFEQALQLKHSEADYFGVGPVYHTPSKPDATNPIGIDGLEAIVETLKHKPCVGIGGLNADNARYVYEKGAGVAVISAISQAKQPEQAAAAIIQQAGSNNDDS
jgi:thiamine-phosphate pyrophosphorylase